jgi:hypothetical protein
VTDEFDELLIDLTPEELRDRINEIAERLEAEDKSDEEEDI